MHLSEQSRPELTEVEIDPRRAALNAELYCFLLDKTAQEAERYAGRRIRESSEKYAETYRRSRIGIEDSYFLLTHQEKILDSYGEEGESFKQIAREIVHEADDRRRQLELAGSDKSSGQRILLALRLQVKQRRMSEQQRSRLYRATGYSNEESQLISRRIGKSLALTAITGAIFTPATAAVVAYGKSHPFLGESLTSTENLLALGTSYALHYGAVYKNGISNHDLLREEKIGTSPNVYATSMYYLLKKLAPEHKRLQDLAIAAGSIAPTAVPEALIFLPTLFSATTGPSIVVGRNIFGAGLNLAQTKINDAWRNKAVAKDSTK